MKNQARRSEFLLAGWAIAFGPFLIAFIATMP
jgi:hypothetical protein